MTRVFKCFILSLAVVLSACANRELNTKYSNTTGWNYYDQQTTNFEAKEGVGNAEPIGMLPIQGGTFTIGEKDEFVTAPRNNLNRSITVSSFFMDKYEITNLNWNEYLHWLRVVFGNTAPELVKKATPDHNVWRSELAYNDPYIENYFEHPAYSFYPVVGVTWEQAMAYCQWRTDRVNEMALIKAGVIQYPDFAILQPTDDEGVRDDWETETGYKMASKMIVSPENPGDSIALYFPGYDWIREQFVFNTDKYLNDDRYNPADGRRPMTDTYGAPRKVNRADGLFVTGYRLPTEAEFEFAAYAPIAGPDGLTIEGKIYPWSGYHPRDLSKKNKGLMQANFVRGRGDMMGVSGNLNDGAVITAPVDAYVPNDFGLYNMAGNVNEWCLDVYRETTNFESSEYNSFRGNIYSHLVKDEKGKYVLDSLGCLAISWEPELDLRNHKDGDSTSVLKTEYPLHIPAPKMELDEETGEMVEVPGDILYKRDPSDILCIQIDDRTRVYKGGSWADRIYWLNPSTRRYLQQDQCSATVGFRCAMSTLGEQIPSGFRAKK